MLSLLDLHKGLGTRSHTNAEIRDRSTRTLNGVIDLGRKNELQLRSQKRALLVKILNVLTGYLSSGKKGKTALMLSLKIPNLLGTIALATP